MDFLEKIISSEKTSIGGVGREGMWKVESRMWSMDSELIVGWHGSKITGINE
jgi:hypothetical protein